MAKNSRGQNFLHGFFDNLSSALREERRAQLTKMRDAALHKQGTERDATRFQQGKDLEGMRHQNNVSLYAMETERQNAAREDSQAHQAGMQSSAQGHALSLFDLARQERADTREDTQAHQAGMQQDAQSHQAGMQGNAQGHALFMSDKGFAQQLAAQQYAWSLNDEERKLRISTLKNQLMADQIKVDSLKDDQEMLAALSKTQNPLVREQILEAYYLKHPGAAPKITVKQIHDIAGPTDEFAVFRGAVRIDQAGGEMGGNVDVGAMMNTPEGIRQLVTSGAVSRDLGKLLFAYQTGNTEAFFKQARQASDAKEEALNVQVSDGIEATKENMEKVMENVTKEVQTSLIAPLSSVGPQQYQAEPFAERWADKQRRAREGAPYRRNAIDAPGGIISGAMAGGGSR